MALLVASLAAGSAPHRKPPTGLPVGRPAQAFPSCVVRSGPQESGVRQGWSPHPLAVVAQCRRAVAPLRQSC